MPPRRRGRSTPGARRPPACRSGRGVRGRRSRARRVSRRCTRDPVGGRCRREPGGHECQRKREEGSRAIHRSTESMPQSCRLRTRLQGTVRPGCQRLGVRRLRSQAASPYTARRRRSSCGVDGSASLSVTSSSCVSSSPSSASRRPRAGGRSLSSERPIVSQSQSRRVPPRCDVDPLVTDNGPHHNAPTRTATTAPGALCELFFSPV